MLAPILALAALLPAQCPGGTCAAGYGSTYGYAAPAPTYWNGYAAPAPTYPGSYAAPAPVTGYASSVYYSGRPVYYPAPQVYYSYGYAVPPVGAGFRHR